MWLADVVNICLAGISRHLWPADGLSGQCWNLENAKLDSKKPRRVRKMFGRPAGKGRATCSYWK